MKQLILALALTAIAADAHAISRYNSLSMSCGRVQATIDGDGAAIMRYQSSRSGVPLFGRYVADGQFCAAGEYAKRVYIPAADAKRCPVLECEHSEFDDGPLLRPFR